MDKQDVLYKFVLDMDIEHSEPEIVYEAMQSLEYLYPEHIIVEN